MKAKLKVLSQIESPDDVKKLPPYKLPLLAKEIRELIIDVVHKNGGHLASNLGVVELTIALHRVFSSPQDKIIWDVGHQCYTHKLITGRRNAFSSIRVKDGLSGFPKRSECEHDCLETGHASTSISAGLGMLLGMRLQKDNSKVIAVIGDGALTGGMAFEGLNHAGHLKKDLIVIYNDNNMSISPNVGGLSLFSNLSRLSSYLSRLTATPLYQSIRDKIDRGIRGIPFLGYALYDLVVRMKKGVKALLLKDTLFSELGFEYVGPIDGHSIFRLERVLQNIRNINRPVVVHVVTRKGQGYEKAEGDPTYYHGVSPLTNFDGKIEKKTNISFTEAFGIYIHKKAAQDKRIVSITAAMAEGTGLSYFQNHYPDRFFDVGITEQHAVTFAAGLAAVGMKPVAAIYSTFMQRAVDQVIHDVALPHLPVVFALDRAGLVGGDGETHQGVYDVSLFRAVPGLEILAPAGEKELALMFDYAFENDSPVMVRYPKAACPEEIPPFSIPLEKGRGIFLDKQNSENLLIVSGGLYTEGREAAAALAKEGILVDLYNLRFLKPLDEEYYLSLFADYKAVLVVEEGSTRGGVGEYFASLIKRYKLNTDYRWIGVPDKYIPHARRDELIKMCGLDRESIADVLSHQIGQIQAIEIQAAHNKKRPLKLKNPSNL